MITTYINSNYRITYEGVSMVENALSNPNLVQISVTSGCTIVVPGTDENKKFGIDYLPNGEARSWKLNGLNTRINKKEAHFIFARLGRNEESALLIFSTNDYRIDGSVVSGETEVIPASDSFFYIKVGSITATDAVGESATVDREITYDGGYYRTDSYNGKTSDLFTVVYDTDLDQIHHLIPKYPFKHLHVFDYVRIGDAWLKYDPESKSLYVEGENEDPVGFWTKGFLSSKGLNPGTGDGSGGDGSATALYQLNDVAKNESGTDVLGAAPGKVLTYGEDGKWYAADAVGLDETALAAYLTSNDYAKKSDIPSLSGYATEQWVLDKGYITSAALTGYATQSWVNTQLGGYATSSALKAVSDKLNDFLTGTDTDNVINKWKELEDFLTGFQETDTLAGALNGKVDKEPGKGLSSNDFTDALLAKLNGIAEGANKYILPVAKAAVLGGVMIGSTLTASATGVLDLPTVGTAGTYFKVTTDAYGRVTSGSNPTTLAGFGITDGVNAVTVNGAGNAVTSYSLSGHALTLVKGTTFLTKAAFDDLFEKVNIGTSAAPVYAIKAKYGLYTDDFISSKGLNPGTGGSSGGSDYDRLDAWSDYTADKAGYVLSAGLGNDLNTRLKAVEAGGAMNVTTTGSGNVVTAVSKSGNVITVTKGITALTSHQSLANYVTLNTEQTITAVKTFSVSVKKKTATITRNVVTNDSSNDALIFGDVLDYTLIRGTSIRFQNTVAKSNIKFENDGEITASKFIKSGGTASQFLMADGSVKALSDITSAYVTALGTSGNYLTWTKNGVVNNITVPYASNAGTAPRLIPSELTNQDLNSYTYSSYSGRMYYSGGSNTTTNRPSGISAYGLMVWRIASGYTGHLLGDSTGGWHSRFHNGTTWSEWKRFAFTTDNVASATKLATARTLWGKSFNGTANVSGAIQIWGATSPTPSLTDEPRLEFAEAAGTQKVALVYSSYDSYRADAGIKVIGDQNTIWFECPNIYGALKGNANTATILQTARTINGTSFNGSANIVTSYWGTARNIKIGEVTKSVNGSANVEFTRNDMKVAYGQEVAYVGTTTADGWYRIAMSPSGISNAIGIFTITASSGGYHTNLLLCAGISFGNTNGASLAQLGCSNYNTSQIKSARIVYTTSYSGNYAYLEVQTTASISTTFYVKVVGGQNWTLLSSLTAGSIPSGYLNKAITLYTGAMSNTGDIHSMGYLKSTLNGNTIQIGSSNTSWAHFNSTLPFYFNTRMNVNGHLYPHGNNTYTCGGTSNRWSNVYATAGNFSNYIDIGSIRLTYDSTNNAIKVSKTDGTAAGLYTEGFLSSKGLNAGTGTGGGGTDYDRLDAWSDYAASKAGWVLSAGLGNDLNTRLKVVEQGGAMNVTTTGSGNAVTAVSKSGTTITVTKGATFSLSSHTHSYLPLAGGTITGALGKSNNYLFKPNGGDYRTKTATVTGAICISLPANVDNTMISMWIDVYNYVSKTSFSVHVGGYTYNNSTFVNAPFAMVYGATHKVRLTYNNGFKIYIGETNTTWSCPQVSVRDVVLGFGTAYTNWLNNWSVSFVTSFPATINAVFSEHAYTTLNKPSFSAITSKPTTLAGYGITDAKIAGGVITLGANSITPLTAHQSLANYMKFDNHTNYVGASFNNISLSQKASETYIELWDNISSTGSTASGWWNLMAGKFIKSGGTVSQFLMADGSVATKVNNTGVNNIGWTSSSADALRIPTMNDLAYWNGRYDSSKSNLQYCDRGRFGDIVTQSLSGLDSRYVNASGDTMTGTLNINHINNQSGSAGLLGYKVINDNTWFVGAVDLQGIIRSNNSNLLHRRNSTDSVIWDAGNDGSGSGLDADMLDGLHGGRNGGYVLNINLGSIVDYGYSVVGLVDLTNPSSDPSQQSLSIGKVGVYRENAVGGTNCTVTFAIQRKYNTTDMIGTYSWCGTASYLKPVTFIYKGIKYGGFAFKLSDANGNIRIQLQYGDVQPFKVDYKKVQSGTTTVINSEINNSIVEVTSLDNKILAIASSATKLQTARTLWGQSFNGTADVNGHLSIGKIFAQVNSGRPELSMASSTDVPCDLWLGANGVLKWSITARSSGESYALSLYNNTTGSHDIRVLSNGNVGIGTTSPGYKLEVNGSVKATGYFYSDGWFQNNVANKGLYNSAGDARWYWNGSGWYSDKSIIVKDRLDIDTTGRIFPHATSTRRAGVYGVYDSTKIGHIWSMGTAYVIADDGANFGNLYGFAYKHTNNTTGGTMASGHQAVWCVNGTPKVAMGDNLWTSGSTTTSNIIVSSTEAVKHLAFSRGNFNYITAPASGSIAFVIGQDIGDTTSNLIISNGQVRPGTTNATSLGLTSYRWSNVYTQLLNVASTATLSGAVSIGGTLTLSSGLSAQYSGSSWLSMATRTNCIYANQNNSVSSAHCLFRTKWYNGYALCYGGLGDRMGFFAFNKSDIDSNNNSVLWNTYWTSDGTLYHNGRTLILSATGETLKLTGTATKKIWLTGNTDANWGQIEGLYAPVSNLGHNILMNIAVGLGGLQLSSTNGTLMIIGQSEILANGVLHNTTGMYSDGYVSSKGLNTSDRRLKTDIKSFNATSIIKSLRPVSFKWNNLARKSNKVFDTDEVQYGLIAQEVKAVAPWAAVDNMFKDGYMGVRYEKFIPVLMKAQIETIDEVTDLKRRLSAVECENERLRKEIQMLKVA